MKQQLAHHTITGCNMQTGDLLASGTISGKVSFTKLNLICYLICLIQYFFIFNYDILLTLIFSI